MTITIIDNMVDLFERLLIQYLMATRMSDATAEAKGVGLCHQENIVSIGRGAPNHPGPLDGLQLLWLSINRPIATLEQKGFQ